MKRTLIKILCLICLVLFFAGCSDSQPTDMKGVLISTVWILSDENGNQYGTLKFSDGRIILRADINDDEAFVLDEECVIDDSKIYIVSESLGTPIFDYNVDGDTLYLSYSDRTIYFTKS